MFEILLYKLYTNASKIDRVKFSYIYKHFRYVCMYERIKKSL